MTLPLAGYPVYIYRAPGIPKGRESRNLFYQSNIVLIIDDGLPEGQGLKKFLSPEPDMPAVSIKSKIILQQTHVGQFTDGGRLFYAEPVQPGNYEFGGTFIFSDHPDFSNLSTYPIPLHDLPKP